ncbi:MAG: hypothetical protein IPP43_02405 [Chitinophagaceae bacterium]|nr:hypothetical protein [Chitinophagaceae bacterium]
MKFLQTLLDWSEVWALLIPLIIIAICNPKEKHIRILRGYVLIGFILNFSATFMLEYYDLVPTWMYVNNMVNNNLPYNIHSIIRVLFFSWYIIITIGPFRFSGILKLILAAYMVLVLINFILLNLLFSKHPSFCSGKYCAPGYVFVIFLPLHTG